MKIAMVAMQIVGEIIEPGMAATDNASGGATIVTPNGPDLIDVVRNLITATFGVVGVIAVIMMIIGGVYYTTSQGSPERVQKGKNTILYGIVGLVVCLSAFAIVNFILASLDTK